MANLYDLVKNAIEKVSGRTTKSPSPEFEIESEDKLKEALVLFTAAQNRVEIAQASCNTALLETANTYTELVLNDVALMVDLEPKIKAYVLTHKDIFPEGEKTMDYKVAKVSYRDVPTSLVIDDESAAAKELLDYGMAWAVKTTHSVIKDAVKAKWEELCKELKPKYMRLSPLTEAVIIKPAKIAKAKVKAS